MNGIPWIMVAILVTIVVLGIAVVVAIRKSKTPRRVDYRNQFVMGIVWIAIGLAVSLLPWLLHGETSFPMGLFFFIMGIAYTIQALVNRDKWGKQVELPPTKIKNMMIVAIVAVALLILGIVVFELYR